MTCGNDAYFDAAKTNVRVSYRLWALKEQMSQLVASYPHSDMAASGARFYALKDAIRTVEGEMN